MFQNGTYWVNRTTSALKYNHALLNAQIQQANQSFFDPFEFIRRQYSKTGFKARE